MKDITPTVIQVEVGPGARFEEAVAEAIEYAALQKAIVRFRFNDTPIQVGGNSDPALISRAFWEIRAAYAKASGAEALSDGTVRWGSLR